MMLDSINPEDRAEMEDVVREFEWLVAAIGKLTDRELRTVVRCAHDALEGSEDAVDLLGAAWLAARAFQEAK